MSALVDFLRARLDKDKQWALAASQRSWDDEYGEFRSRGGENFAHILRHDPARTLREVEAKRATLADYEYAIQKRDQRAPSTDSYRHYDNRAHALYRVLVRDAAVHADHPDHQQEWEL